MTKARLSRIVIGALVCGLLMIQVSEPAAANHVGCGDVITQDTTLDSDLIDCPENGLVVGASDVTLDLGGHTVDGIDPNNGYSGILVSNRIGVTVRNGDVYDFYKGLEITGFDESRNLVDEVTVGSIGFSVLRSRLSAWTSPLAMCSFQIAR